MATAEKAQKIQETQEEILGRQKKIAELQEELEKLQLEDVGEHKIVYELEFVHKDLKKGGDPFTKAKTEFFPNEGKCIYGCGFDARDSLGLPPHPEQLTVSELQEMNALLKKHIETYPTPEGVEPGHPSMIRIQKVGVVPAGDNPKRIVEYVNGRSITAAEREARSKRIKKQIEAGREAYQREAEI